MIPDSFKQDLLNRVDIVDVVSSRVALKKSGASWIGLCPFHTEKTPSFSVSPAKQFYHCFGCGAHGNAIGFLMEYGGLGYVEAMRELAESAGMKLPELPRGGDRQMQREEGPDLHGALERAARFYRENLKGAPRAIDYLKGRGLSGKTAALFGIGYAPAGWQGLAAAFERYDDRALVESGLVVENDGKRYDRFRDRVMFPILNHRGVVVGFGGRSIPGADGTGDAQGPKYMNSPETAVFEKGRELYGLPQARESVRAMNRVVVVEGYMDVVMLAEHGVRNAVATLGTATTPTHVQKLLKQADEVVFCFDGDAAGRRAAWHALEVSLECLADRKTVRFLFLPAEHDPDSFVREFGREAFEERIAGAETLSAFLLRALTEKCDLRTLEGRSKLVAEAKPLVKRIAAPALRVQLVRALAGPAQMEPGEVARLLEVRDGLVARAAPARPGPAREDRAASRRSTEGKLLRAILGEPELAQLLPIELVGTDSPDGAALAAVADWVVHHADAVPRPLSSAFEDEAFYPLLAALEADLLDQRLGEEALRADFDGLVRRLRERAIEREIKALEAKAGGAGLAEHERAAYGRLIREQAALRQPPGAPPDLVAAARTPI